MDALRVGELLIIFSPTIFLTPVLVWTKSMRHVLHRCMVWSIQLSGPTFIKLGQWASTRPDLFYEELCQSLSVLQSKVHPLVKYRKSAEKELESLDMEDGRGILRNCLEYIQKSFRT